MRNSSTPLLLLLAAAMSPSAYAKEFTAGSRVLVKGFFSRQCSARVESVPAPGFYRLAFDRQGCGDAHQPYEAKQLQTLTFVEGEKVAKNSMKPGDTVVLKGFHAQNCSAQVKEVSRSGYVALNLDALLCADTDALRKTSELTKVAFVESAHNFALGQRVKVQGIQETCAGIIRRLTSNGLAALDFEQPTCTYSGQLFNLEKLEKLAAVKPIRQASGERIFQRIMREIASSKKTKRSLAAAR